MRRLRGWWNATWLDVLMIIVALCVAAAIVNLCLLWATAP